MKAKYLSLSHLQKGDIVEFEYESCRCSGVSRYLLRFTPSNPAHVEVGCYDLRSKSSNVTPLGTVILTLAQVQLLDNLLEFYRSKRPGGCTTTDRIRVQWILQKSNPLNSPQWEYFVDGSCQANKLSDADSQELLSRKQNPDPSERLTFFKPVLSLFYLCYDASNAQSKGVKQVFHKDKSMLERRSRK
jgi:hypothetical protein